MESLTMQDANIVFNALRIGIMEKGAFTKMLTAKQITEICNKAESFYDVEQVKYLVRMLIKEKLVRFYDVNNTRYYGLTNVSIKRWVSEQRTQMQLA